LDFGLMASSREGLMMLKSTVICDVMQSSAVEVHRHFGATFCLHLQGRRTCQVRNRSEVGHQRSTGSNVPPKRLEVLSPRM
jgi:hypothetical protein